MARYYDDFQGIIGHDLPGRGMDPNYRGAYRGMRMGGDRYQAAYGRYRLSHADDFGGSGGFRGRYGVHPAPRGGWPARQGRELFEQGRGGGGVRDLRYDRELLHEFNANSPSLERGGRYDRGHLQPLPRGAAPWSRGRGQMGYSNRGMSDAGYSEGWAWGPMRGAR